MSGPPPAATQTTRADPPRDRAAAGEAAPIRTGRLLGFVRKLIDYGRELAGTLRHGASATNHALIRHKFGTPNIALILAYVARALQRASALEARLLGRIAHAADGPPPTRAAVASAPPQRKPRPAQPAARRDPTDDPCLALLPTPEQIAADVRRRPIGAVIADICRDLGIMWTDPLWREVGPAIVQNGGSYVRLIKDIIKRISPRIGTTFRRTGWRAMQPEPCPPLPAASGAGPP